MSLVEINSAPVLNLRVFKRGSKKLVLLWNKLAEIEGKQPRIVAKPISFVGQEFEVKKFTLDDDARSDQSREEVGNSLSPDQRVVICAIDEDASGLREKEQYSITVSYPDAHIHETKKITGAGVFPPHDKEDRDKNIHNYLWDDKGQSWRKQYGVMHEGKFYMPVVIVPCPSCGHDPNKGVRS